MHAPTFKYCAARFLNHWVEDEAKLCQSLQRPSPDAIRKALAYFKVSRGFKDIGNDNDIPEKIGTLLKKHSRYVTQNTSINRVNELASAFKEELKLEKSLVSAASKLLWLRRQSPFVIYDSRAVRALRKMEHRISARDYGQYINAWQKAFSEKREQIEDAVQSLPSFIQFTAGAARAAEVSEAVKEDWFAERVFDQYLWITGKP